MRRDNRPEFSVAELSGRIRTILEGDPLLRDFVVRGELQGVKRHSSGHVYFTLVGTDPSDGSSVRIDGVLFRSQAQRVLAWPREGDEVLLEGRIGYYPPQGRIQLYGSALHPVGRGAQARAKEELRRALDREGLFDPRVKRPFPPFPRRVALVTSPTGAALQDVLKVAGSRFPQTEILIVPALVQGVDAPEAIVRGLRAVGRLGVDCALLVRGGGSRDDLNPFDEERVVRAVRLCPVPVATGVGHQVDLTLADLAADLAAPTPSAAAERVFPDREEVLRRVRHDERALASGMRGRIGRERRRLDRLGAELGRVLRERRLIPAERLLAERWSVLRDSIRRRLESSARRAEALEAALGALSPRAVLERGYAVCLSGGCRVRSASGVREGDGLTVQFLDGDLEARVGTVRLREEWP
jgi:exodeoxyribonuclease VII large subunit